MTNNVIKFPKPGPEVYEGEIQTISLDALFSAMVNGDTSFEGLKRQQHAENRLNSLRALDLLTLRKMWDEVSDMDSYYDGEHGHYDCAEIHRVLNEKGDGYYCAV